MQPLYTDADFQSAKSRQLLPLRCLHCDKTFYRTKHAIQACRPTRNDTGDFCSLKCGAIHQRIGQFGSFRCENCEKTFVRKSSQIKKYKHHFCSQSCAGKWHNAHKTTGTRRSKLEVWLEEQLRSRYRDMFFKFNKTDDIDAELDIFIPSLRLAFELNGIFHYEPIYGDKKLASVQSNDHRKMLACAERGIELCVLDVSSIKNFKPLRVQKFLNIITGIIDQAIGRSS